MTGVKKVLMVGGGVGGMCSAICLARGGIDVDVVEINREWNTLGAGLTLNGATLRAFDRVGVLSRIVAEGATMPVDPGASSSAIGPDVGGILRPVLHRILADATAAAGIAVRTGVTFETIDQEERSVAVTFTDGGRGRYDLVVGADGLSSKMRQLIFPDAIKPQFTGQGCWRAVFARPPGYRGGVFGAYRTAGLKPVSQDQMYLFLLQAVPDNRWMPPEKWLELLGGLLAGYTEERLVEAARGLGPSSLINYRPLEKLMLPPPWHKGRVLLIGDAAHSTTPHMAYGAGLAVEDAVVLSEVLRLDCSLSEALDIFVERRFERCKAVVDGSVAIGQFQLSPGPLSQLIDIMEGVAAAIRRPL
jgi:2-polyprenyl-6-methoxyphenol hydroxylase-like FAD-dependent oxidoreductase